MSCNSQSAMHCEGRGILKIIGIFRQFSCKIQIKFIRNDFKINHFNEQVAESESCSDSAPRRMKRKSLQALASPEARELQDSFNYSSADAVLQLVSDLHPKTTSLERERKSNREKTLSRDQRGNCFNLGDFRRLRRSGRMKRAGERT